MKYPLCERAGLRVDKHPLSSDTFACADVEDYLRSLEFVNIGRETVALMKDYCSGERTMPIKPKPVDTPWEFKDEDFRGPSRAYQSFFGLSINEAMACANAKLREWIEASLAVYSENDPACAGLPRTWGQRGSRADMQARLIDIKPIEKPDTAEGLLRELFQALANDMRTPSYHSPLLARARKLLEPK